MKNMETGWRLFKAAADINNGVFSLKEAANFYKVHPAVIVQFIAESSEYDMVFSKRGDNDSN